MVNPSDLLDDITPSNPEDIAEEEEKDYSVDQKILPEQPQIKKDHVLNYPPRV